MLLLAFSAAQRASIKRTLAALAVLPLLLIAVPRAQAAPPSASGQQTRPAGDMYTPWLVPSGPAKGGKGAPTSRAEASPLAQATVASAQAGMRAMVTSSEAPSSVKRLPTQLAQPVGLATSSDSLVGSIDAPAWLLLAGVILATALALRPARGSSR